MGRDLLYQLAWVVAIGALLVSLVRYLLARRVSPSRQTRQRLIAALCRHHGMLPDAISMSSLLPASISGQDPVFENSFASNDGGLWAADMWMPRGKEWDAFSMLRFKVPSTNLPSIAVTRKGVTNVPINISGAHVEFESIDFDDRFTVIAVDRRAAVMLLDQGMMQWLLDCDQVSFVMVGDTVQALVRRSGESTYQPGLDPAWHRPGHPGVPASNPRRADPVELQLLFKFCDGFRSRVPTLVRTGYATGTP